MVRFESRTTGDLAEELVRTADDFRQAMYRVTDRLGIAEERQTVLGWGPHVVLYALKGKAEVIRSILHEASGRGDATEDLSSFRDWSRYREEFAEEIAQFLRTEVEASVMKRLARGASCPESMFEINEFDFFRGDRDTIELFKVGYGLENGSVTNFQGRFQEYDDALKKCVHGRVIPEMKRSGQYRFIKESNIPWLPIQFWWRHL